MSRKVSFVILGVLIMLLLSGCFEVSTLIKIKKDGSGTMKEIVFYNKSIMAERMPGFGTEAETGDTENSFYDEQTLKSAISKYGENVSYVSSKSLEKDGKVGYEVVYEFEDITKLNVNQNPAMGNELLVGQSKDPAAENLRFEFKKGKTSELIIKYPQTEEEEEEEDEEKPEEAEDMEMGDEEIEALKSMFGGMKFKMEFEFDGEITKTNSSYQDGKKITFLEMDFEKIMDNADNIKKLESVKDDQDEMKKVMKGLPGVKVEMGEEVRVKFK
ncbi:MAG: hypothetical protein H8E57_03775 [Candidatus Cloacimonetes bacterium]|nr:hypothetical protein [Candidatus Cloacimonadota bacterium]